MSKTLTKKLINVHIQAVNIRKAFDLMGLEVLLDADFQLYGRKGHADLVIPASMIQSLGQNRLAFSNGLGININADGSATMVYDHYNEKQAHFIEKFLNALNELGQNAHIFEEYQSQGYTIKPLIGEQELGIFLSPPQEKGCPWTAQDQKGGFSW